MSKKFTCIVSDPAWSFDDSLKMSDVKRGAAANYDLMSNQDIIGLDVKSLADPDGCVLALWVPSSLLQEGLDTMKSWGFEHKQTYIWVKTKLEPLDGLGKGFTKSVKKCMKEGAFDSLFYSTIKALFETAKSTFSLNESLAFYMGRLFRQTHEVCLIGINNRKIYKKLQNKSQRSVSLAPNLKHSAKPDDLQKSLEAMFPGNNNAKLELFSRRQRKDWLCLGNEAPMTRNEDIRNSLNKLNLADQKDLITINKVISCYDGEKDKELFEMWSKISNNK